jgi:hypothetical protein
MRDVVTLVLLFAPFAVIAVAVMLLVVTIGGQTAHSK